MSSLIWVHTVCYIDVLNGPADDTEQTTFSRDILAAHNMRGSINFFQRGPFFLENEWIQIQLNKLDIISPPAKLTFHWRADDGPTLNAGLEAF